MRVANVVEQYRLGAFSLAYLKNRRKNNQYFKNVFQSVKTIPPPFFWGGGQTFKGLNFKRDVNV